MRKMINYTAEHPKWLPYAFLTLLLFIGLGTFFNVIASMRKMNTEKTVATLNPQTGETKFADFIASNKTTSAAVTRFLVQWKAATYSSSGKNPDGTPDNGSFVAGQQVPTPFMMGMKFFVQPFRDYYVPAYSSTQKDYPFEQLLNRGRFSSQVEQNIAINALTEISPGKWTAEIISTQTLFDRRTRAGTAYVKRERVELIVVPPQYSTFEPQQKSYSPVFSELEAQRLMFTNFESLPIE
jgi:hypothetical protein